MSCELRVLKLCDRETNVVLQERTNATFDFMPTVA